MVIIQQGEFYWMWPYAMTAFLLWLCYMLYRFIEMFYSNRTDRLVFRDGLVFRKLSRKQKNQLASSAFYEKLSTRDKNRYEHRIKTFLNQTEFIGREGFLITEEVQLDIAALACMLTLGRRNYLYNFVDTILLYPDVFYSTTNGDLHKGEFNPRQRVIVFSWKHFKEGNDIDNDNLNLGLHEFMHALQADAMRGQDLDALRFQRVYQRLLRRVAQEGVKEKIAKTQYFRAYAFTNEFEFMAVLTEYFFESPLDFKSKFPDIYRHLRTMLNFNFAGY